MRPCGVQTGLEAHSFSGVIGRAQVLVVRFQVVEKRLLIDFRTSSSDGPLVKAVAPVGSAEERFRTLRVLRPTFSPPDRISTFAWPRGLASFERSGVLGEIRTRLIEVGTEADGEMMREAHDELVEEERATVQAAVRGGEGFKTLWERGGGGA